MVKEMWYKDPLVPRVRSSLRGSTRGGGGGQQDEAAHTGREGGWASLACSLVDLSWMEYYREKPKI